MHHPTRNRLTKPHLWNLLYWYRIQYRIWSSCPYNSYNGPCQRPIALAKLYREHLQCSRLFPHSHKGPDHLVWICRQGIWQSRTQIQSNRFIREIFGSMHSHITVHLPSLTISICAAFQRSSWVSPFSSSACENIGTPFHRHDAYSYFSWPSRENLQKNRNNDYKSRNCPITPVSQ